MKSMLLAATLLCAAPALAQESEHSMCAGYSKLSATLMRARQAGVPMAKMMDGAVNSTLPGAREMVIAAYERPRYVTPEMQQREIEDFQNDIYLQCITAKTP